MGNIGKKIIKSKVAWDNQAGTSTTKKQFEVTGLKLPRFTQSKEVTTKSTLFDTPDGTRCDLILGRYFKKVIGMEILNGS